MITSVLFRYLIWNFFSATVKHTLPELPYAYNALEPVICAEIMELHHSKHHATYVNNLNAAEEKLAEALAKGDVAATVGLQVSYLYFYLLISHILTFFVLRLQSSSMEVDISITPFSGR